MKTIILSRDDINNPLDPNMWAHICESLDIEPEPGTGDFPDEITLKVINAEANW